MLAADGSQTEASISWGATSLSGLAMRVTYRYYLQQPPAVATAVEEHAHPVARAAPAGRRAAQGRQLLGGLRGTQGSAAGGSGLVFGAGDLPDASCSLQWSVSLGLALPAELLAPPYRGEERLVRLIAVGAAGAEGWPAVGLLVAPDGALSLACRWGDAAPRLLGVRLRPDGAAHLLVVRDGRRLGVWLDGQGGWLLRDVWCPPDAPNLDYCRMSREPREQDAAFLSLEWVAGARADGASPAAFSAGRGGSRPAGCRRLRRLGFGRFGLRFMRLGWV